VTLSLSIPRRILAVLTATKTMIVTSEPVVSVVNSELLTLFDPIPTGNRVYVQYAAIHTTPTLEKLGVRIVGMVQKPQGRASVQTVDIGFYLVSR
jgi:hypothetical protein